MENRKIDYYDVKLDAYKDLTIGMFRLYTAIFNDTDDYLVHKEQMRKHLKRVFGGCKIFVNKKSGVTAFYVPNKKEEDKNEKGNA